MGRSRGDREPLLGAGLAAGSWLGLRYPGVQRWDVRVGDAVRLSGSGALDRAVIGTTDLGSMYAVVGMAAALAASGRRRLAADVLGVGTLAWAVAQASKTTVRRQRPFELDGVRRLVRPPTGSSFPSGHAAVAAAVTSVIAGRARPGAAGPVLRAAAGYVALSRVYVGVHYPTDVVGGAGLGLVLGGLWRGPVATVGRETVRGVVGIARRVTVPWRRSPDARAEGRAGHRAPRPPPATPPRPRRRGTASWTRARVR